MISQTVTVCNKIGIHSRPASLLVNAGKKFKSAISITHGEKSASTKSLIGLLALKVKMDHSVTVSADGEDEQEALREVVGLIESKFGEE